MTPVVTPRQGRTGEASRVAAKAPAGLKTTLSDVIAALQRGVEPAEDDWIVALVVRWLRARRLTMVGDATVVAEAEAMAMARKTSSGDAAGRCPSVE
jgi:hypothetical protein